MLFIAPVQWLLVSTIRFVERTPLGGEARAVAGGLIVAGSVVGTLILQGRLYTSGSRISRPRDNYFLAVAIIEELIP